MATKAEQLFIATETGVTQINGEFMTFQAGVTRVRAGHPLLRACPLYFELVTPEVAWIDGKRNTPL